jgi:hypothetical protein
MRSFFIRIIRMLPQDREVRVEPVEDFKKGSTLGKTSFRNKKLNLDVDSRDSR